jgi:dUTP pyrophosphatase
MKEVKIIKCEVLEGGSLPVKAHYSDAGYDLFATSDIVVAPGEIIKHPLNVKLQLPDDCYMEIASKSGNGVKGLLVYAGIIDEDYRGVINVVAHNLSEKPLEFKKGAKLAQLLFHPYTKHTVIMNVEKVDTNTKRGTGGFGSTGQF